MVWAVRFGVEPIDGLGEVPVTKFFVGAAVKMKMRTVGSYGLSTKEAKIVRGLLEKIRKREGELKPIAVVEAARSPRSPLHKHFEWDDTEAARLHRLAQASDLIRRVKIEIIDDGSDKPPLRVNSYVSVTHDSGRHYKPIMSVLEDESERAQLLSEALAALQAIKRKYAALSELANVIAAINQIRTKAQKRTSKKRTGT